MHRTALGDRVFPPELDHEVNTFMEAKRDNGYKVISRRKWRVINGRGFYVTTVFWYDISDEVERKRA
jgi:hypothetical protein